MATDDPDDRRRGGAGERPRARNVRRRRAVLLAIAALLAAAGLGAALLVGLPESDESPPGLASPTPPDLPEPPPEDPRVRLSKAEGPLAMTLVDARSDGDGGLVSLRARNRGDSVLSISDRAVRVRQDGASLRPAPFPATRLPRFRPSIAPGGQDSAIVWFPRMRSEGAVVTVPWFTTDVDVDPTPVVFRVAVREVARVEDAES